MTEQEKTDINKILKTKRKASEHQRKHLLKASIIASQKRKSDKIKLEMLKELEENKIDIHKILEETREKKRQKEIKTNESVVINELPPSQNKMEPINTQMEPVAKQRTLPEANKLSLKDRLRYALL